MPNNSFTMFLEIFTFSYCEQQHFLSLPHPTILLTFFQIAHSVYILLSHNPAITNQFFPWVSEASCSMMNIQTYPEVRQMFHTLSCYLVPSSILLYILKLNIQNEFLAVFPSHLQQSTNQNPLFIYICLTLVFTTSIVSALIQVIIFSRLTNSLLFLMFPSLFRTGK